MAVSNPANASGKEDQKRKSIIESLSIDHPEKEFLDKLCEQIETIVRLSQQTGRLSGRPPAEFINLIRTEFGSKIFRICLF